MPGRKSGVLRTSSRGKPGRKVPRVTKPCEFYEASGELTALKLNPPFPCSRRLFLRVFKLSFLSFFFWHELCNSSPTFFFLNKKMEESED